MIYTGFICEKCDPAETIKELKRKLMKNKPVLVALLCIVAFAIVALFAVASSSQASDLTNEANLIAMSLPIEHVTKEAYDLVIEELEFEQLLRDALEHKLFMATNSNRVLRDELVKARKALCEATCKLQFREYKVTEPLEAIPTMYPWTVSAKGSETGRTMEPAND